MNAPSFHSAQGTRRFLALVVFVWTLQVQAQTSSRAIGIARVEVTPVYPIRLTGYAARKTNSIGIEQKLWAKALAIGTDAEGPAILMTLDNCGIAEGTYKEVAQRLAKKARIRPERLVISCSHTHTGPCTTGWAPNIFAQDIPSDEQVTIDRYTRGLIDKLEQVALAALRDRRPGKLSWSQGRVGFARNRRVVQGSAVQFGDNASGPVDQALPVLLATDEAGGVRALVANYACHCTTLGGEINKVCGDWAGFAQEALEREHPGAIAFITIGCGADSNPFPRGGADGGLALARQHGEEIAMEVKQLLTQNFTPLNAKLISKIKQIELPFGPGFSRAQWEDRAQKSGIVGYHAKKFLARLDSGEKLPETLSYYVQTWNFGDELALVFLSGEVVVDYVLRLKQEFDPARLWVTAYANYVPCYIPSRRILQEGGYEAEDSLWYYDRPGRLSTNVEDLIVKTISELLPKSFSFDKQKAELPPPRTVEQALASFRTKADFTIEVVAAEPLIESPVAIDWGADGRLWVCEMYDYPSGVDGKWKPGGRVKVLKGAKGDGNYDTATLFLEGIPFPTGIMAWRKGVLICAAPDILYAEDTDGDGKADVVKKLYSGFATHNFQARVNGLAWGLDGWVYGASGLFGGKVKSLLTGQETDLSGRDFRIKPDSGEIEAVAGISQQGRIRDDWGNWFGNDNSTLLWHFPLPDHYVRRNPNVTYPDPRVNVASTALDPNQLYPISRTLERFNDPQSANHTTSACGPEIYRDDLLGTNYYGNAFICEPVHNLLTRLVLEPRGATFAAHRAFDEQHSEFFASTDNWFRPVQVRTGPDGALWVVDMYRFVIEHPRWIPPERLKQLDPRAGADKGRIYRIYPRGAKLRSVRNLTNLSSAQLVGAINTPNGPTRDLVHEELSRRWDVVPVLEKRVRQLYVAHDLGGRTDPTDIPPAAVRAQMLCAAAGLIRPTPEVLRRALLDAHSGVRRQAVRLSETFLSEKANITGTAELKLTLFQLAEDSDPGVRFQLVLSVGEWEDWQAAQILARLSLSAGEDPWFRAAIWSAAPGKSVLQSLYMFHPPQNRPGLSEILDGLIATAVASKRREEIEQAVVSLMPPSDVGIEVEELPAMFTLAENLARKGVNFDDIASSDRIRSSGADVRLREMPALARQTATDANYDEKARRGAIRLLGELAKSSGEDQRVLLSLVGSTLAPALQPSVFAALQSQKSPAVASWLLESWKDRSPALRGQILNLFLNREEWIDQLLAAIEHGNVSSNEVPLPGRQRLLNHLNADIRARSTKLFAPPSSSSRAEALRNYQVVNSLAGIPERGAAHFDKNCASCHAYRGHGQPAGPNLAEFAGKSVADFLVAILDPNAAINPHFLAYSIETKDGRSLSGIVKGETASSLTLVQGGGVIEKVLRGDIKEIRASQLSLMPEGLEQSMAPQDLADLIAWLKKGAPPSFGSAGIDQAAEARAEFFQGGAEGLAQVVSASEQMEYPSWLGRLPLLHCRQTDGHSKVAWQTGIVPSDLPPNSVHKFRLAVAMGLLSQPAGKFQFYLDARHVLDFDVSLSDQVWQNSDGTVRMLYTVMENNAEDSNGSLVIQVASSLLEAGKAATFEVVGSAAQSQRWFGVYLLPKASQAAGR